MVQHCQNGGQARESMHNALTWLFPYKLLQLSDPPQASAKVRTTRRFSDSAASPCDFPQPFHLQPSDIGGQIRSGDAASYRRPKTCPAIFSKVIDAGHKLKKPPQVAPNPQDFIYEELAPLPPPLTTSAVGYEQVTNFKHNRNDLDPPQQNCKQQQNGFDQALPPRNPYVKFSSKASQPDEHCAEMSINAMAAQIEEMQERLAKIVKLMDEVLKKQSHFEAELSTLSGTGGNLKKKILLVNKGMSAADVSEVNTSYSRAAIYRYKYVRPISDELVEIYFGLCFVFFIFLLLLFFLIHLRFF